MAREKRLPEDWRSVIRSQIRSDSSLVMKTVAVKGWWIVLYTLIKHGRILNVASTKLPQSLPVPALRRLGDG